MIDTTRPEIAFAMDIVGKASQLAARIQTGMAMKGLTKSDFSPVTVADFAVQAIVAHALEGAFPGTVLVGEERAKDLRENEEMLAVVTEFVGKIIAGATDDDVCGWIDQGAGEPGDRFWTVDPIDGTKGYLRGGQYAVALALIENGKVVQGTLGCPNLGDDCKPDMGMGAILIAQRGEGAFYSVVGEPLQPLKVSDCADIKDARVMRSVESGHTNAGHIGEIIQRLGIAAEPVLMDSQAKYAVLAAGGGELLFRLLSSSQPDYKEKVWDQAAGSIVLEEAGGRITDLGGKALDFAQGRTLAANTGVFASNGPLHDAGLEAIAAVCPVTGGSPHRFAGTPGRFW